jgi:hypothetical protein
LQQAEGRPSLPRSQGKTPGVGVAMAFLQWPRTVKSPGVEAVAIRM